jgi:hypothetical protein
MSTVKANAFVDGAGGNTATINGIPLRPGILDPQNLIINGAMDFWQRGTSSTAGGYVAADRWINVIGGGTVTMSRQSFTVGDTLGSNSPTFFLRQTVSGQTLANQNGQVQQRIEGVRSYAGQTITVLGWARRSSGSGNFSLEAFQSFGTGGSPSAATQGAGQIVTLTGSWAPFAVTIAIPSITGKTLGTAGDDYLGFVFWTSAGSDFNARSGSLGLQTIGVDLWGIHVKLGTQTTAAVDLYKQPELQPELARCQRYYEKSFPLDTTPASNTGSFVGASQIIAQATSVAFDLTIPFLVAKRATPTVATYSPNTAGTNWAINTDQPVVTIERLAYRNIVLRANSPITQGRAYMIHWVVEAEL